MSANKKNISLKQFPENQVLFAKTRFPFWIGIGFLILIVLAGCSAAANFSNESTESSATQQPVIPTQTTQPSIVPTQTQTLAPTIEVTPTPSLRIGSTKISPVDQMEMMYIPAGNFMMGNDAETNERPAHTVTLDAFWMDKFEVTNAQFQNCVNEGNCDLPKSLEYFDKEEYQNHPVVFVNWYRANRYCEWAGRRLPTEAEWEMAARGPNAWTYPWGDDKPAYNLANYDQQVQSGTRAVGSYPHGASVFGVMDLAGNVYEWVNDWYAADYYSSETIWINPQGPAQGDKKGLRGGSWIDSGLGLRSANRDGFSAEGSAGAGYMEEFFGFRCAESAASP
jgi:formylglycine-generating enzyme required for sulfatase activity